MKPTTFLIPHALAIICGVLASPPAPGAPLLEEGFDYPAGTALAADPPWSGNGSSSVGIVDGNLTLPTLQGATPPGNSLAIVGGNAVAYRNFSSAPVVSAPGTAVYFSTLVNCAQAPTNRQFIASLLYAGATSANPPDDPLDLYVTTGAGGYRLSVSHTGADPATAGRVLTANTTHLIVMKYTFGGDGMASLYLDPVPGNPEPATPDARTQQDDDGSDTANLQVVLLQSLRAGAPGNFVFDTVRIGTNWSEVTPLILPVSVTGPQNQAVCLGEPAVFGVTANGMPPFTYQWRTNGMAVGGATNSTYTLSNPGTLDALNGYDVVVHDQFGAITSAVVSLAISRVAPDIITPPGSEVVMPGVSNAIFSLVVAGDAPLGFQWRTNGVAIPDATNASYTIANPGPADATNALDVVVANPCGAITSSPPVTVIFPNQFCLAYDAGAGFFSGENLILTNISGASYYVWSSPDPGASVTGWYGEGLMSEVPLGTAGKSRYGINLNPVTSPVYYIFAPTNTGPYTATEAVMWLTTPDFATFYVASANVPITADGIFQFPAPPTITQPPQSQTVLAGQIASFNVQATGPGLGYQWLANTTGISGAVTPVLSLSNVSAAAAGPYAVIVTNSLGSVTSSVATLTVLRPPVASLTKAAPGGIQLNANTVTGLTYWVETATNLANPIWLTVLTNNSGNAGVVEFQTNAPGGSQFYRLVFP